MKTILYLITAIIISGAVVSCKHKKTNLSGDAIAVTNHGVNIAYTDTGRKDTTLLFVHGWGINKTYWDNQVAFFGKNYRVVAIDLPGFGQSGKNRKVWDTGAFASDVDSVIKELDLKNVILVGHSMSGDIVLQSAIDNPDRVIGLVGIDNFKGPGTPVTEQGKKEYEAAIAQMKLHFKAVATDWFNKQLFSKTTPAAVKEMVLADVDKSDSTIAIASLEGGNDFREIDKLKQAKKKLYLINSDIQPVDTTYLAANKLPYQVYYIKGSGHYPMVEHAKEFNADLEKVISSLKQQAK